MKNRMTSAAVALAALVAGAADFPQSERWQGDTGGN